MARQVTPESSTQLVSLTGVGAILFVWAYFVATLVLALWTVSDWTVPALPIVAIVLYAAVCLAVTLDRHERLSLPVTLAAIAVGPVSVVLVAWQLVDGGYTAWYVGAATAMLFLVNLRGRILFAWIGCAFFAAALIASGFTTWAGVEETVLTAARQSAILGFGTLTAIGLRRTGRSIRHLTAEADARSAAEAANLAASDERAGRLADLRRTVVPLLERIAADERPSDADRLEFAAAEAELRDGLRARGLRQHRLVDAAKAARTRGVDVVLLDDSDPELLDPDDLDRFADIAVSALGDATDGRVIARLLPPGRDSIGTVVADGSNYSRHEVPRSH